jgi:hypothetical protein
MVKSGKKTGAKKQKQQQRRPSTRSPVTIDGAAVAHIRLMADPCMGRLTPPAYPGSTNGAIMRFRNVISLATGASETAGLFHWNPSINEYYANGAATATTAYTPSASSMFTYLQTGGTSNLGQVYRCIAGCVRIIFNGSENNRGGYCVCRQHYFSLIWSWTVWSRNTQCSSNSTNIAIHSPCPSVQHGGAMGAI